MVLLTGVMIDGLSSTIHTYILHVNHNTHSPMSPYNDSNIA